MKKFLAAGLLACGVFASAPTSAALITFDEVASGTNIETYYSGLGVTFSSNRSGAFVASRQLLGSNPNRGFGFSDSSIFDEAIGVIRATFSQTVSSVSVDAQSIEAPEGFLFADFAYMRAYDANNNLVGEVLNTVRHSFQTLTLTGSIAYVEFSATRTAGRPRVFGSFDNLNFTFAGSKEPDPVPEPAALGLIGLGLLGIAGARRRKMV